MPDDFSSIERLRYGRWLKPQKLDIRQRSQKSVPGGGAGQGVHHHRQRVGPDFRDGISRALYVTAVGRRVIIVRVFVKKTQKTPSREIDLALSRAKEIGR